MRLCIALMLLASGSGAFPVQADPLTPVYTSIQNCTPLQSLALPGRVITRTDATAASRCRGVAGYDLAVVEEDPRSWLAVLAGGRAYPLSVPMVQTFTLGHFPGITETKLVEWRVNAAGAPHAFIVRVHYQAPDAPANAASAQRSTLMVFDLRALPPRLLGMSPNNDTARRMADGE